MKKTLPKFIFAALIVYWLVHSGRIDFSLLLVSTQHWERWILSFCLLVLNVFMATLRWKKLLELKSQEKFSFQSILKLTWIGNLFNTVLPGAVSGDLIKIVYARRIDKNLSKTYLITSAFIDRLLGLFGLIIILGISTIANYSYLLGLSPQMKSLIQFNLLLFSGVLLAISTLFLPQVWQDKICKGLIHLPIIGKHISKIFNALWIMAQNKIKIFRLILLSIFIQIIGMLAFWLLVSPYFHFIAGNLLHTITFLQGFTFLPIGFITVAIPISPSGLGVGHAAFDTLFKYFGVLNGASLFNLYFILTVTVNLLGIFPYLLSGMSKKTREEFNNHGHEADTSVV